MTGECIKESHWKCIIKGIFNANPSLYDKFEITKIEICTNKTTNGIQTTRQQRQPECHPRSLLPPEKEASGRDGEGQSGTDTETYIIIIAVSTACVAFVFLVGIYLSEKTRLGFLKLNFN